MVRAYEYEKGLYEYTDKEGYKRIGRWEQKYLGDRDYYSPGDRLMNRKKVGMVDFYNDEEGDDYVGEGPNIRRECPHSIQYGVHNKLSGRILNKGQEKPVDYDQFLQCVKGCGNIFPVHEVEREKILKADTRQHKVESEFDAKKSIVMSVPSRASPAGRKISAKKRRERNRMHHHDPDIDREIQQYGEDNVKIIYDSDP